MNERIKDIFKRAGGKTSTRNLMSNPVQVVETHELWDDRIDKFAELIVRECIAMADEFEIEVNRSGLVDRMKEHFGVGE